MIIERESGRNDDSGEGNKKVMILVVRTIVW